MNSLVTNNIDNAPIALFESTPGLLSGNDMSALGAIVPELSKAMVTRQIFRTETEARVSVLNKMSFPTNAAKYWQIVREQVGMIESLAQMAFEYRRNEVAIKRARKTIESESTDEFDREEAQITLEENLFKQSNMQTAAADRVREVLMWSKLKSEVDDGSFDTTNVNTHQLVSYTTQFALTASMVDPSTLSSGEYTNLVGQLQTMVDRCVEVGVIEQVKLNLPSNIVSHLKLTEL